MEWIRAKRPGLSLDMAPLIDIVFQLLIFFMLSSSFLNPALKLDLPRAARHDQREPERIVVSMDRSGVLYVNESKTLMSGLREVLRTKMARDPKKSIHLRGDKDMPYKFFVEVMDIARQAGAQHINIVHEAAGSK